MNPIIVIMMWVVEPQRSGAAGQELTADLAAGTVLLGMPHMPKSWEPQKAYKNPGGVQEGTSIG